MKKEFAGLVVVMLALGAHTETAIAGGGHGATKDHFPVSWQITHAACPNIPVGATINGAGVEDSITTTTTLNGITTITNTSHATGNATDEQGNTYVWNYSNHFSASNTVESPDAFSGPMTDAFSLAGNGPYRLSNGFLGTFTFGPGNFYSITETNSRGDPLVFGDFAANACDPL